MQSKSIPSSVSAFLKAHGAEQLVRENLEDLAGLVRVFRENIPAEDSDPFSQENLTYLTALVDCISVMDEQLYEHYRALIDLFRADIFRAPREKLLAYPSWNALREKGVALGILAPDLFGKDLPRPHVCQPDAYLRLKGGARK